MSGVLTKAREHWAASREGRVDVTEWGCGVYFKAMTLRDHNRFEQEHAQDPVLAVARLVQIRALDAKGARMFDDELSTATALTDEVDPNILLRIATAMRGQASAKTAAKN